MKKLGPIILGFIIGAVLTYFFCPRPGGEIHAIDTKIKIPKDTISVAEATKLFKNWQQNNPTEIDSTIEVEGSRKKITNVGWSLSEVRDYLDYAEAKSDSLGFEMTGIRVYMGNYGKNPDPALKNRNTLFIAPVGIKNISKGSTLNLSLQGDDEDTGAPPLNRGAGGGNEYP
ncbi:hypothetical protein SAMN05421824_2689 [Hyunsoonleella jejuensis]|uniref:Uncharacterized protein n=1 Tax=Hyunsoonleella jejuensis TaxID=419940 RepID=A0A1H9KCB3_9FLAO|nr:hypothetical protein [Hyunsoonleella jejuensis]SEQ96525.1 hypothetical protein SAMN05421824_2689 [Hyunsoonleella jejuensis]